MTQPSSTPPAQILSRSPAIALLLKRVQQVADTDIQVLILGEPGVGKDLLARTIHHQSTRGAEPFHAVNCASLPAGLVESELFGHEKGAFTGATRQHAGSFEQADGGTLFLDEIGDMSMDAQRTLLRVLEQKHLTRVGGTTSIPIEVRIMATTNRDLQQAIEEGTFREDLYYRLSGFLLTVPPLRQRRADIPLLAAHFVQRHAQRSEPPLNDAVLAYLKAYDWPGNVRELEHWIERMIILSAGEQLGLADVLEAERMGRDLSPSAWVSPIVPKVEVPDEPPLAEGGDEKQRIIAALQQTNWIVSGERGAARLLGMSAKTLAYRMHKYGIQRPTSA